MPVARTFTKFHRTVNNPKVSDEAKQDAKERLNQMGS